MKMFRRLKIFFLALIVLSALESAQARKFSGGRHHYPKSGGLSGSGGHHYPSSGGLSGNSHGYPSSGGLSGTGSHGYPSSGGLSGSGSHGYPSAGGGSHAHPSSGNSHGYPGSGGLSGSGSHGHPAAKGPNTVHTSTTNVHHHYHYSPPQKITYTPVHGGAPVSYPVYHGPPPTYVYQYKNSDSKYGTLLAGLALLNLGTLAGSVYANRHSSYKPRPGEICKFGIRKDNGDYQETKIDCELITSFIFEAEAKANSGAANSTITTTTVTNVTVVNTTNSAPEAPASEPATEHSYPLYSMLPNGTLVPVNITATNATATNATAANNTASASDNSTAGGNVMTSSVTSVTTTNTTVTNALDVKGKPIDVTPGMKCYVIRNSPTSNMRRSVPCGLLQSYADQSIRKNSASTSIPSITILCIALTAIGLY